jgi:hypothetical protein
VGAGLAFTGFLLCVGLYTIARKRENTIPATEVSGVTKIIVRKSAEATI